jgi:aspartyl-tRNA(Asn)/glutamyl-tRNA(Gln) amidotransferase subunit C
VGIEPMSHAQDVTAPFRDDAVTESDRHADYQRGAPAVEDGLYLVPRVIE